MKNTHDTPETDATTSDFDNSARWTTEDFQRALRTISELRRELQEARAALSGQTHTLPQAMNLTNEEIRIKAAESLGWTGIRGETGYPTPRSRELGDYQTLSNYPESLDACAEFEAQLLAEHPDLRLVYRRLLIEVCEGENDYWRATARQRCLAYLKTKGLIP